MEVTGKLKIDDEMFNGAEATIELPSVDVSKIGEGDEVWVKTSVRTVKEGSDFIELNCCNDLIDIANIIAHFPQPKQEQEVKVPERFIFDEVKYSIDDNVDIKLKINEIIKYLEKRE